MKRKQHELTITTSMLIKNVPKQLRDCFKAKCALLGVSMREMILSFMEEKVKERKP